MRLRRGFTLTELLIVIAVLGILAGMAVVKLNPQAERARAGEAVTLLTIIRQAEESYRFDHNGAYQPVSGDATDADWDAIGLTNPNQAGGPFHYFVPAGDAPPNFVAMAQRNPTANAGNYAGTTIGLMHTSDFCGTHPFTPRTADC